MKLKLILIPIAIFVGLIGYFFYPKTVTLTLPQKNAVLTYKNKEYKSPVMIKHRTGNFTFVLKADEYEPERPTVKVGWQLKQQYTVELDIKTSQIGDDANISSKDFPFIEKLPQTTSNYEVDIDETAGEIVITLFAILNRPEQLDEYELQLKAYGKEALDWIKANGTDPAKLKIKWLPEKPEGF